jgi:hypothetical protein
MSKLLLSALFALLLPAALLADAPRRRAVIARDTSFERVLVPLIGEIGDSYRGFNHYWFTELWVKNDSATTISVVHPALCFEPARPDCPGPQQIPPAAVLGNFGLGIDGSHGAFLSVPWGRFSDFVYTLRVQDIRGETPQPVLGVELPLVREEEFGTRIHLLDLPGSGGISLRKQIRIFRLGAVATTVVVRIFALDPGTEKLMGEMTVTLLPGEAKRGIDFVPAFALVDLTDFIEANQQQIPQARISVEVIAQDPGDRIWAFATIIDDPTGRLTVITQGKRTP